MRPIGAAAFMAIGGLLWAAGGVIQAAAAIDPVSGYKESLGVMLIIAGAIISSLGAVGLAWAGSWRSTALRRTAVVMLVMSFVILTPWPFLAIGYYGHIVATIVFGALIAARQRVGVLLVIAALVATAFNTESTIAIAAVPLGLAWVFVAMATAARRSPTAASAVGI